MSELRREPITGRWLIVDKDREMSFEDYELENNSKKGGVCPFCYGNEHMTPPELTSFRTDGSLPNTSGWLTRTVPNKFPALIAKGNIDNRGIGMYDMTNGIGDHEVLIETPDHYKEMSDLELFNVEKIIEGYKDRSIELGKDKRFKYILIFKNYGMSAGASLEHPHSQLIALPIVPKRVKEEIDGSHKYFNYRERCIYCDIISQEKGDEIRIVCENENFLTFAPFVSRFPFEMWIIPKQHESDFRTIKGEKVKDLAAILKQTLLRIKIALNDPSFNFNIHTAPLENKVEGFYHWHIEIMPKLTHTAGFEWGSGFYVNFTPSSTAAKTLREVKI